MIHNLWLNRPSNFGYGSSLSEKLSFPRVAAAGACMSVKLCALDRVGPFKLPIWVVHPRVWTGHLEIDPVKSF